MRFAARFSLLLLAAGLGACSRPVAPAGRRAAADPALSPAHSATAVALDAQVRLRFVGSVLGRPRANFYVSPRPAGAPCDTVPAWSVLKQVLWRPDSVFTVGGAADLAAVATGRDTATPFSPGLKFLDLQAPARLGGGIVTVRFFSGRAPDTWWAGPDPARWPVSSDGDGRAVDVTDWARFTTVPAWPPDGRGYFGPDSFATLPSLRLPPDHDFARATFWEIWGDRIYARSEGDTVHQGAWVVVCNGGWDWDSPYLPKVESTDPGLPPGYESDPLRYAVLLPAGRVGSPIGFRLQAAVRTAGDPGVPDGLLVRMPQTSVYPAFLPASVFRLPRVMGYWPATIAGKAYLVARAEDADGVLDSRVDDPVRVADSYDAGDHSPALTLARRKVLVFHVRYTPPASRAAGASPVGRPIAVVGN